MSVRRLRAIAATVFAVAAIAVSSCSPTNPTTTTSTSTTTTSSSTTTASTTTTMTTTTTTVPDPAPVWPWDNLDPTGKTIPSTNYTIPVGAIFMSPAGSDSNNGSIGYPVKTLNRAIPMTPAGGTIVLRGGEYRDWYNSNNAIRHVNKSITLQAYPNESPWFVGSETVTDWEQTGSIWSKSWSTPQFCGGKYDEPVDGLSPVSHLLQRNSPCSYADAIRDSAYPVAGDPQMGFVGDRELKQKGRLDEVTPGSNSFYYDWNAKRLYVSQDPALQSIEFSTKPGVVTLGGPYDFKVRGIGFKRYASSIMGNTNSSVVYVGLSGPGLPGSIQVENSVFTENAGMTLMFSGPKPGSYIKSSIFSRNHYVGAGANGFANSNPGARNDLLIERNIFSGNNTENIDTQCGASCGAANIKINHMTGFKVDSNLFENAMARASGFWCDLDCSDGVMINNVARDNGGHGIWYEVSNTGIIANNLSYHNSWSGIAVASANTKIYNNTVVNKSGPNVQAVWIFDDNRKAPDGVWPYVNPRVDLGPNTRGVEFGNNLIVGQQPAGARLLNFGSPREDTPPNTTSNEYFSYLDHNVYYHLSNQNLYMWNKVDAIKTPDQLRSISATNFERSSRQVIGSGDPFKDRRNLDFRLEAYLPSGNLPVDVQNVLGFSPSSIGAMLPKTD